MPIAPAFDISTIAMNGFSAIIWTAGTIAMFVLALLFTLDTGRGRRRHRRPRSSQPHPRFLQFDDAAARKRAGGTGLSPRTRP